FELGGPGSSVTDPSTGKSDRIVISGDLVLEGEAGAKLALAPSAQETDGKVGLGYYRLISYAGEMLVEEGGEGLTLETSESMPKIATYSLSRSPSETSGGHLDLFVSPSNADELQHWQGGDGD